MAVGGKLKPWDSKQSYEDKVAEAKRKDALPETLSSAQKSKLERRNGARK